MGYELVVQHSSVGQYLYPADGQCRDLRDAYSSDGIGNAAGDKYVYITSVSFRVFSKGRGGKMMIIDMKGANIFSAPMFILAHI